MKKLMLILTVLYFLSGCEITKPLTKTYNISQEVTSYKDPNIINIRTKIIFYNYDTFGTDIYNVVDSYNMDDTNKALKQEYEKADNFITAHKKLDYIK